ncbi:hypothetical protein CCE28_11245 [Anaeromicrobium sediminis]|uniref:Uncharacterized protein n=2 Tax=Anaeromicrobium sediminis TaxID=1478221 RepID=A0A267MI15_9FIRM|nr:hypothetical protein CCE28_11245 [Anaeromicrobium sediminis]
MFNNLSILDKITVVGAGIFFFIFMLIVFISKIRYEWKREELSQYLKECKKESFHIKNKTYSKLSFSKIAEDFDGYISYI